MSGEQKPTGLDLVLSPEDISRKVKGIASQIDKDYSGLLKPDERLVVMGVLNGGFIFMADLVRELSIPVEVDFIRLSSYQDGTSSTQQVVMLKAPEKNLHNRHVLIVEDLSDCGLTLNWLRGFVTTKGPASVKIAVAVDKIERRAFEVQLDYVAYTLSDGFLVGYGMDYAQSYRNMKGIWKLRF
jgi:hypoxanthine phosphoribosyltransferase